MSPVSTARRISYVIPPPTQPIPRLALPRPGADRHGLAKPLLIPENAPDGSSAVNLDNWDSLEDVIELSTPPTSTLDISQANPKSTSTTTGAAGTITSLGQHPKHRLGVTSFALDTSTMLSGKTKPEGILYSGGRDGVVIAHELGASLKQRLKPYGSEKVPGRSWESITGWMDNYDYDQDFGTDADGHAFSTASIPFEDSWELELSSGEPTVVSSPQTSPSRLLTTNSRNAPSGNQFNVIPIGSMIFCCVTSIGLVSLYTTRPYPKRLTFPFSFLNLFGYSRILLVGWDGESLEPARSRRGHGSNRPWSSQ